MTLVQFSESFSAANGTLLTSQGWTRRLGTGEIEQRDGEARAVVDVAGVNPQVFRPVTFSQDWELWGNFKIGVTNADRYWGLYASKVGATDYYSITYRNNVGFTYGYKTFSGGVTNWVTNDGNVTGGFGRFSSNAWRSMGMRYANGVLSFMVDGIVRFSISTNVVPDLAEIALYMRSDSTNLASNPDGEFRVSDLVFLDAKRPYRGMQEGSRAGTFRAGATRPGSVVTFVAAPSGEYLDAIVALAAVSDLSVSALADLYAQVSWSGDSEVITNALMESWGSLAASADSNMTAASIIEAFAALTLSGDSTMTIDGAMEVLAAAGLVADSGFSVAAQNDQFAAVTMSGDSALTVASTMAMNAAISWDAGSNFIFDLVVDTLVDGGLSFDAVANMSLVPTITTDAVLALDGQTGFNVLAISEMFGSSAFDATSSLNVQGGLEILGAAVLDGSSSMLITGDMTSQGIIAFSGLSQLDAAGTAEMLGRNLFLDASADLSLASVMDLQAVLALSGQSGMSLSGNTFSGYPYFHFEPPLSGFVFVRKTTGEVIVLKTDGIIFAPKTSGIILADD